MEQSATSALPYNSGGLSQLDVADPPRELQVVLATMTLYSGKSLCSELHDDCQAADPAARPRSTMATADKPTLGSVPPRDHSEPMLTRCAFPLHHTEPTYLHAEPCTAVLSDTRPIELAPSALAALNYALDELLQLWVHASLTPSSSSSASGIPGPIGLNEVLSTERLKAGVIRIVGPATGKNVALEAELAVRELLSSSPAALRSDPALKIAASSSLAQSSAQPTDESSPQQQAEDIFRLLRDWVHDISGLGGARRSSSAYI